MWEEVATVKEEKRYELVLHGGEISERIVKNGLDMAIFTLTNLNFLQISQTTLSEVPSHIGELVNLRSLDLHQNKITALPVSIGKLLQLKYFDVSTNSLVEVPSELGDLLNLHTFNVSCNQINSLPSFTKLQNLSKFDCSHNKLEQLPCGIHQLQSLYEVKAKSNAIGLLSQEISGNTALKVLDLSENQLETLPPQLADCHKLKDLMLNGNPIADNRLKKLIAQCSTKAVLDYARNIGGKSKGKKGKKKISNNEADREDVEPQFVIKVERNEDYMVVQKENVVNVRPYIVCAIARNIDLGKPGMFKKFINLQTKLHESLCDHRTVATIATHCLASLSFPLLYEALPLDKISLVPLGKQNAFTAFELVEDMKATAVMEKQRTKRQAKSGLLKYVSLVEDSETLACLKSSNNVVISLPPITNSDVSKISSCHMDILLEVTSCDLNMGKSIMNELVKQILDIGLFSTNIETGQKELMLSQVRICSEEGNVKVVYPSKLDLCFDRILVKFVDK